MRELQPVAWSALVRAISSHHLASLWTCYRTVNPCLPTDIPGSSPLTLPFLNPDVFSAKVVIVHSSLSLPHLFHSRSIDLVRPSHLSSRNAYHFDYNDIFKQDLSGTPSQTRCTSLIFSGIKSIPGRPARIFTTLEGEVNGRSVCSTSPLDVWRCEGTVLWVAL